MADEQKQTQEPVGSPKQRALLKMAGLDPGPFPFSAPSQQPVPGAHPADLFKSAGGGQPSRPPEGSAPWNQPWQQPEEPEQQQPEEPETQFYPIPEYQAPAQGYHMPAGTEGTPSDSPLAYRNPAQSYRYEGTLRVGDQTFDYASGGRGGGASPKGEEHVTGFTPGAQRAATGHSYVKDAFEIQDRYDPALGRNRQGVLIHSGRQGMDVHHIVTSGCFAIPAKQWPQASAAINDALRSYGGRGILRVGKNGEAELVPEGSPPIRYSPKTQEMHPKQGEGLQKESSAGKPWEMYKEQQEQDFGKKKKNIPSLGAFDRTPIMPEGFRGSRELVVPDERRLDLAGKGYRNITGSFADPPEGQKPWEYFKPGGSFKVGADKSESPQKSGPWEQFKKGYGPGLEPLEQYAEESAEGLKRGAKEAYEGAKETVTGFMDRFHAAQLPYGVESGALGRTITGPAARAGIAALSSPAAEAAFEAGAGTGFTSPVPRAVSEIPKLPEKVPLEPQPHEIIAKVLADPASREGDRVMLSKIRSALPGLSREEQDSAIRSFQAPGSQLYRNDVPRTITPEQQENAVQIGKEPRHFFTVSPVGAAPSPYRPPALPASEAGGAGPLIRQQYGLAARDTAHLHDKIENEPLFGHTVSMAQAEARATPQMQQDFRRYVDSPDAAIAHDLRSRLSPELQAAADQHKHIMAEMYHNLTELDDAGKQGFVKDYLWHVYERDGTADRASSSWLKERKIPTYEEAIARGLTPKFKSVADIDKAYIGAVNRANAARYVKQALMDQGHIMAEKPAPGWEQLKTGAFGLHGAFAPKAIARDFNRFYAENWDNAFTRTAHRIVNSMRKIAFMPGVSSDAFSIPSGFHAVNELIESTGSELTRTMDNIFARAPIRAGKAGIASTPGAAAVKQMAMGNKGLKIYLSKSSARAGQQALRADIEAIKAKNPDLEYIIDTLTEAHGVPSTREFLDIDLNETSLTTQMKRLGWNWPARGAAAVAAPIAQTPGRIASLSRAAFRQGGIRRAQPLAIAPYEVLRGVSGTMGVMSEPLFHFAIPRMKLGVNIERMRDWMASNPFHTREEAIAAARKIADATDNVMGEMNRDNLVLRRYMSRKAIQALDLLFLAPSWNIGSAELAARGATGGARALAAPVTRRIGLDPNAPSFSMRNPHWDPNMTSSYGTILGALLLGGIADWLMTGKPPQEPMDLVSPLTGERKTTGAKSRRGEPVRLGPMGNLGWDLSAMHALAGVPGIGQQGQVPGVGGPMDWLIGKTNPLISMGVDAATALRGGETQGQRYRGEKQPSLGGILQDIVPFSMQPLSGAANPDLPMWSRILGLREAGMEYQNPEGFAAFMRRKYGPKSKAEYKR